MAGINRACNEIPFRKKVRGPYIVTGPQRLLVAEILLSAQWQVNGKVDFLSPAIFPFLSILWMPYLFSLFVVFSFLSHHVFPCPTFIQLWTCSIIFCSSFWRGLNFLLKIYSLCTSFFRFLSFLIFFSEIIFLLILFQDDFVFFFLSSFFLYLF